MKNLFRGSMITSAALAAILAAMLATAASAQTAKFDSDTIAGLGVTRVIG